MNKKRSKKTPWKQFLRNLFGNKATSREQLLYSLKSANEKHIINDDAYLMINGVLQVTKMHVRDVMIPHSQMMVVNGENTPSEALPTMIEAAHSRFPVMAGDGSNVLGILIAKDLLRFCFEGTHTDTKLKELVRPAVFIPESKRLHRLLEEFRVNRNHMAIVVDEYGNISGLITIEDVLEQIVGDIEDEHDAIDGEDDIKQISPNEYTIQASTSMSNFNRYFKTNYNPEGLDSIGGFFIQKFGRLPKRDESIVIDDFKISVILANKRQVHLLRLVKLESDDSHEAE